MAYATIAQLRSYLPQVAELGIQRLTITGSPTGGTFTLGYEGSTAAPLSYNATATQVQTALRAIPSIGSNLRVSGRPGGPWVATFQGVLATDAGPISLAANGLTGGTAPTVAIEPYTDQVLQLCLDNASATVRSTMRSLLADPSFDYAPFGAASSKIVHGHVGCYLRIPPYQLGSVTKVETQTGTNPASYTVLDAAYWDETGDGRLYRADGWAAIGQSPRYQITAVWGYGASAPGTITEVTLELAVNIWRSRDKGGFSETIGVDGSGAIRQVAGLTQLQMQTLIAERDTLIAIGV